MTRRYITGSARRAISDTIDRPRSVSHRSATGSTATEGELPIKDGAVNAELEPGAPPSRSLSRSTEEIPKASPGSIRGVEGDNSQNLRNAGATATPGPRNMNGDSTEENTHAMANSPMRRAMTNSTGNTSRSELAAAGARGAGAPSSELLPQLAALESREIEARSRIEKVRDGEMQALVAVVGRGTVMIVEENHRAHVVQKWESQMKGLFDRFDRRRQRLNTRHVPPAETTEVANPREPKRLSSILAKSTRGSKAHATSPSPQSPASPEATRVRVTAIEPVAATKKAVNPAAAGAPESGVSPGVVIVPPQEDNFKRCSSAVILSLLEQRNKECSPEESASDVHWSDSCSPGAVGSVTSPNGPPSPLNAVKTTVQLADRAPWLPSALSSAWDTLEPTVESVKRNRKLFDLLMFSEKLCAVAVGHYCGKQEGGSTGAATDRGTGPGLGQESALTESVSAPADMSTLLAFDQVLTVQDGAQQSPERQYVENVMRARQRARKAVAIPQSYWVVPPDSGAPGSSPATELGSEDLLKSIVRRRESRSLSLNGAEGSSGSCRASSMQLDAPLGTVVTSPSRVGSSLRRDTGSHKSSELPGKLGLTPTAHRSRSRSRLSDMVMQLMRPRCWKQSDWDSSEVLQEEYPFLPVSTRFGFPTSVLQPMEDAVFVDLISRWRGATSAKSDSGSTTRESLRGKRQPVTLPPPFLMAEKRLRFKGGYSVEAVVKQATAVPFSAEENVGAGDPAPLSAKPPFTVTELESLLVQRLDEMALALEHEDLVQFLPPELRTSPEKYESVLRGFQLGDLGLRNCTWFQHYVGHYAPATGTGAREMSQVSASTPPKAGSVSVGSSLSPLPPQSTLRGSASVAAAPEAKEAPIATAAAADADAICFPADDLSVFLLMLQFTREDTYVAQVREWYPFLSGTACGARSATQKHLLNAAPLEVLDLYDDDKFVSLVLRLESARASVAAAERSKVSSETPDLSAKSGDSSPMREGEGTGKERGADGLPPHEARKNELERQLLFHVVALARDFRANVLSQHFGPKTMRSINALLKHFLPDADEVLKDAEVDGNTDTSGASRTSSQVGKGCVSGRLLCSVEPFIFTKPLYRDLLELDGVERVPVVVIASAVTAMMAEAQSGYLLQHFPFMSRLALPRGLTLDELYVLQNAPVREYLYQYSVHRRKLRDLSWDSREAQKVKETLQRYATKTAQALLLKSVYVSTLRNEGSQVPLPLPPLRYSAAAIPLPQPELLPVEAAPPPPSPDHRAYPATQATNSKTARQTVSPARSDSKTAKPLQGSMAAPPLNLERLATTHSSPPIQSPEKPVPSGSVASPAARANLDLARKTPAPTSSVSQGSSLPFRGGTDDTGALLLGKRHSSLRSPRRHIQEDMHADVDLFLVEEQKRRYAIYEDEQHEYLLIGVQRLELEDIIDTAHIATPTVSPGPRGYGSQKWQRTAPPLGRKASSRLSLHQLKAPHSPHRGQIGSPSHAQPQPMSGSPSPLGKERSCHLEKMELSPSPSPKRYITTSSTNRLKRSSQSSPSAPANRPSNPNPLMVSFVRHPLESSTSSDGSDDSVLSEAGFNPAPAPQVSSLLPSRVRASSRSLRVEENSLLLSSNLGGSQLMRYSVYSPFSRSKTPMLSTVIPNRQLSHSAIRERQAISSLSQTPTVLPQLNASPLASNTQTLPPVRSPSSRNLTSRKRSASVVRRGSSLRKSTTGVFDPPRRNGASHGSMNRPQPLRSHAEQDSALNASRHCQQSLISRSITPQRH